ncbi:uncharacterized protein [Montipora capricornis]|uniref:uncharacterized protein n=1 Tax=Montipora capricornis TaxID=246305 RepID=UPI0035F12E9E
MMRPDLYRLASVMLCSIFIAMPETFSEDSSKKKLIENYPETEKMVGVFRRELTRSGYSELSRNGSSLDSILCRLRRLKGWDRWRAMAEKLHSLSPQLSTASRKNETVQLNLGKDSQIESLPRASKISSAGCICGFVSFKCCKKRKRQIMHKKSNPLAQKLRDVMSENRRLEQFGGLEDQ